MRCRGQCTPTTGTHMGIMTGVEAAIVSRLGDTSWLGSLVSAGLTF